MRYYYMDAANQVAGPVPKEGLIELLKAKAIDKTTQICAEGAQEWTPITDVIKSKKKRIKHTGSGTTAGMSSTSVDMDDDAPDDGVAATPDKAETPVKSSSRSSSATAARSSSTAVPGMPQEVVVLNMDVSFGRMITLMLKWAFAAIPALIILVAVAAGLFMGMLKVFPNMKTQCPFGFGHQKQAAPPAQNKKTPADAKKESSSVAAIDDTDPVAPPTPDDGSSSSSNDGSSDLDPADIPLPDFQPQPETPAKTETPETPTQPDIPVPEPPATME